MPDLGPGRAPESATLRNARNPWNPIFKSLGTTKLLTYQRITLGPTRELLDALKVPDVDPQRVREMDAVDQILKMQRVGEAMAKEHVYMDQPIRFFK